MADPGYRWRDGHPQRKAKWRQRLAAGPIDCTYPGCVQCGHAPCSLPVHDEPSLNWDGRPWHLAHMTALKHEGDGTDSTPWHATCNLRDAACLTNHPTPPASCDWWA